MRKAALSSVSRVRRVGFISSKSGHYHRQHHQNTYSPSQFAAAQCYHCPSLRSSDNDSQANDRCQSQKMQSFYHYNKLIVNLPRNNQYQLRNYVSATEPKSKSAPTLIMGFGAIALSAKAGQYTIQAYNQWKESQPPPEENKNTSTEEEASKVNTQSQDENMKTSGQSGEKKTEGKTTSEKRENIFAKFFNMNVGSKYYEGGFDDKMTRREAALILGVRESSTPKRIKEAHRKLLILNHPDTGGSTYLTGKINEAKELLLKGR